MELRDINKKQLLFCKLYLCVVIYLFSELKRSHFQVYGIFHVKFECVPKDDFFSYIYFLYDIFMSLGLNEHRLLKPIPYCHCYLCVSQIYLFPFGLQQFHIKSCEWSLSKYVYFVLAVDGEICCRSGRVFFFFLNSCWVNHHCDR